MDSCPEYVCIWLGLSKIGVVTALINTNLRADTLAHSLKVSNCSAVIIGKEQINGKWIFRTVSITLIPKNVKLNC